MDRSQLQVNNPPRITQVQAARKIFETLEEVLTAERALQRLASTCPGLELEDLLLKVCAVNQLYGTNLYAVVRMARRIQQHWPPTGAWPVELVDTIAELTEADGSPGKRRHLSFASKFAHFFVDPERFPIYDQHVYRRLLHHVLSPHLRWEVTPRYVDYVAAVSALRDHVGADCKLSDLDAYLWIAGQRMVWDPKPEAASRLNSDIVKCFGKPTEEQRTLLELLDVPR